MSKNSFSSSDFANVGSALGSVLPHNLIHRDVLGNASDKASDNASGNTSFIERNFSAERRHLVRIVDLPSKVISMTIGGLEPQQASRRHRHNYETILYILAGIGKSVIDDIDVFWEKGDAVYVPVWCWHQHVNLSESVGATYIACENAPHLQNLGIALREEA